MAQHSHHNKVAEKPFGNEAAEAISLSLQDNHSLSDLTLGSLGIGETGALALHNMLKTNKSLSSLTLNNNAIHGKAFKYICNALKENTSLIELSLKLNFLGDSDMQELYETIKMNKTLEYIDLRNNTLIGDEGAKFAGKMIELRMPNLSIWIPFQDKIGEGWDALKNALQEKRRLSALVS